jgi:LysR family transcriptional regulator, low CO2-responsive transcriptional regulator
MVNSEWLRSFVAFAETLNFTHAAQRLHLSQPALFVQIKKLGEALGAPLYVKRGRALSLTPQGRTLLSFGREQQERHLRLLSDLRPGARTERVVLAAGEGTYLNLLAGALRAFQRRKGVELGVLTRNSEQAIAAVQLGEAHLAVTVADEVPPELSARRIARIGTAVVMAKGHPLSRKRTLSIRDLGGHALIAPAAGRPLRAALARAFADAHQPFAPSVEANGWELMMRFAELGMGLAVVNDFCQAPRGTVRRPLRGLPPVHYQLLRHRDWPPSDAALALEAAIVAHAAHESGSV